LATFKFHYDKPNRKPISVHVYFFGLSVGLDASQVKRELDTDCKINSEMETRYKIVAGSVCGFPKFVTSGSGLGSGFLKIQFWVWGSKFFQQTGFWVQVWVRFCKKHQNTSEIPLEKSFFLYIEEI
jgi:hypothetical protein